MPEYHGHTKDGKISRIYRVWGSMVGRCLSPSNTGYKNYGGRGIKVCERWLDFKNFFADMGEAPTPKHSIDRIDNDGDYEPSNCKWSTKKEQGNNKRTNRLIEYRGRTQTAQQWSDELGIKLNTLTSRLDSGMDSEEAFAKPVQGYANKPIELNGRSQSLAAWCKELGVKDGTARMRLSKYGWTVMQSLGIDPPPARERGIRSDNVMLEYDGRSQTVTQWANEFGLDPGTLNARLSYGWSVEKALTHPSQGHGKGSSRKKKD